MSSPPDESPEAHLLRLSQMVDTVTEHAACWSEQDPDALRILFPAALVEALTMFGAALDTAAPRGESDGSRTLRRARRFSALLTLQPEQRVKILTSFVATGKDITVIKQLEYRDKWRSWDGELLAALLALAPEARERFLLDPAHETLRRQRLDG